MPQELLVSLFFKNFLNFFYSLYKTQMLANKTQLYISAGEKNLHFRIPLV